MGYFRKAHRREKISRESVTKERDGMKVGVGQLRGKMEESVEMLKVFYKEQKRSAVVLGDIIRPEKANHCT